MSDLASKFPSLAASGSLASGAAGQFTKAFVSEREIDHTKRDLVRDRGSAAVLEESAAAAYDPRPLAERLAEARAAKREAMEEQLRFSNLVKRVDDDESTFLEEVATNQAAMEKVLRDLVAAEVMQFKTAQVSAPGSEQPDPALVRKPVAPVAPKKDLQRDILTAGIVRKKSRTGDTESTAAATAAVAKAAKPVAGKATATAAASPKSPAGPAAAKAAAAAAAASASKSPAASAASPAGSAKSPAGSSAGAGLGLVAYGSSDDDGEGDA